MNNVKFENRNFEGFANRTGLYRVWVPLHDDGLAPLISIWIDPMMTAFEPQACKEQVTIPGTGEEEIAEEIEDPIWTGSQMAAHPVR